MAINKILETLEILSEAENLNGYGLIRRFLSSEQIKTCNKCVKLEYLNKGIADEKNGRVAFYITDEGKKFLQIYSKE